MMDKIPDIGLFDSQSIFPMVNVRINKRTKYGKILETREGHNRVTKMAIMGIIRLINGEFNNTTPEDITFYVPRYLALGTNRASALNPGVTTEVTVNDSKLLDEISPRILITQRNIIENIERNPYIKLTVKVYIPEKSNYDGNIIGEAGLFSRESGSNCWARIAFDQFKKEEGETIDVTWEITVISVGENKYPTSISLFNGDYPITSDGITFSSLDERVTLRVEYLPDDVTVKSVVYSSSDPSVATVDVDSGTITPIGNGYCIITATTTNNITAQCNVHVSTTNMII